MKQFFVCLFLCCLTVLTARAEKAWDDGYRPYQDIAPEYLEVKIAKVQIKNGGAFYGSDSRVEIQAVVTQVFRSASHLQQGNSILISFVRKSAAGPLTLEPTLPEEGKIVPAFLRKKGNSFEPAALHHSFEPLTAQQLLALNKTGSTKPPVAAPPVDEPKPEPKKVVKKEKVQPPEPELPPQMIVTAPLPEASAPEPGVQVAIEPTPTPTPKKSKEKKPKVTQPIVITEQEKPTSDLPVILDALPARKGEHQPPPNIDITAPRPEPAPVKKVEPVVVINPTPTPTTAKAVPITVSTPALTTEPLDIKKIDPVVVETSTPPPTPTPKPAPAKPAPATLNITQSPAATAPPAPSSAPFDQEGLSAYSSIYARIKEGDKAADNNETESALKIYKETLVDLERLKANKPDFQPFIVEYRQKDLTRKINNLEAAAPKK